MTAACMDQSMTKSGVVRLADPPEFSEPAAQGLEVERRTLAQSKSCSCAPRRYTVQRRRSPRRLYISRIYVIVGG